MNKFDFAPLILAALIIGVVIGAVGVSLVTLLIGLLYCWPILFLLVGIIVGAMAIWAWKKFCGD